MSSADCDPNTLPKFIDALQECDDDTIASTLYDMLTSVFGVDVLEDEEACRAFFMGLTVHMPLGYRPYTDLEDDYEFCNTRIQCFGRGPHILIELKSRRGSDKDSTSEALAYRAIVQIFRRGHTRGLRGDTIVYGIVFDKNGICVRSERLSL